MKLTALVLMSCCVSTAGVRTSEAADPSTDVGTLLIRTLDESTGKPIRAHLALRTTTEQPAPLADSNGVYEQTHFDCRPGTNLSFSAEPVLVFYVGSSEWQKCSHQEIVFRFSRSMFATDFETILKTDYKALPPDLAKVGNSLIDAINAGDSARAAAAATELAERSRQGGQGALAKSASVVALFSVGKSLKVTNPIEFDKGQNRYVLSNDSVDALVQFQKDTGLSVSGRADWNTLNGLSAGYINELTRGQGS
ncbi:hypothetical protein [Kaistia terrae]|uniref:Peptidoglycan-binding protein n=1 Tax=Kaistia terrae TaxID=537017 RepID=A0ABW0PVP6_9HYPH|nr:hypothetical protein [Kaistia terrae]MCX5579554.1 hypothetical protein [Kaistia terrae]